ncbi:MAG: phage virion morphogenesis protein [Acidobacteria bacterium]|nr:phage virion morphogenesis protein [Acidobacteriota bacterium]
MGVRVRRNFRFREIPTTPGRSAMRRVGEDIAADVRQRTASGRDADGAAFAPGADGEPVDLRDSGRMLDDLTVLEASDRGVKVGFKTERSARIAQYHETGTKHMPARPFIAMSRAMVERAVGLIKARLGK